MALIGVCSAFDHGFFIDSVPMFQNGQTADRMLEGEGNGDGINILKILQSKSVDLMCTDQYQRQVLSVFRLLFPAQMM